MALGPESLSAELKRQYAQRVEALERWIDSRIELSPERVTEVLIDTRQIPDDSPARGPSREFFYEELDKKYRDAGWITNSQDWPMLRLIIQ